MPMLSDRSCDGCKIRAVHKMVSYFDRWGRLAMSHTRCANHADVRPQSRS